MFLPKCVLFHRVFKIFVLLEMGDLNSLATIEPWKKNNKKSSDNELNRALTLLGFGAWSSLEPSKLRFKHRNILIFLIE